MGWWTEPDLYMENWLFHPNIHKKMVNFGVPVPGFTENWLEITQKNSIHPSIHHLKLFVFVLPCIDLPKWANKNPGLGIIIIINIPITDPWDDLYLSY